MKINLREITPIRQILALSRKNQQTRNLIFLLSALVGVVSGLAAVLLKHGVELIQHSLTATRYEDNFYQLIYPVIGLMITVMLARYVYRENLGHAITDILYSIARKSSRIHRSKMYSRLITSPFTVGFGGSAGLESPIVLTGAAIGSNMAQWFKLNYKTRTLMIGCGTAGVISAIFNAPVAGFIFSIEIIMGGISTNRLIPLLLASVSATLTSQAFLGDEVAFRYSLQEGFTALDIPFYLLLGGFCGLFGLFFNMVLLRAEDYFDKIRNIYRKALLGGLSLSLLIFLTPPVYGEGYKIIKSLLAGSETDLLSRSLLIDSSVSEGIIILFLLLVLLFKVLAASVTIAAGGSGGTFAPSLFMGCLAGFTFAKIVNFSGIVHLSEANFALVGMCGVLAGTQHAPLTAIFLIAELTGSYALFLPLMAVSALALGTVSYFEQYSVYTRELVQRGDLLDQSLSMRHVQIGELVRKDISILHPEAPLKDLMDLIRGSRQSIFPVLIDRQRLLGLVSLDDVREVIFEPEKHEALKVRDVMEQPPTFIRNRESLESVLHKFERTGAQNLPVFKEGEFEGFVTQAEVLAYYREKIIEESLEEV